MLKSQLEDVPIAFDLGKLFAMAALAATAEQVGGIADTGVVLEDGALEDRKNDAGANSKT